MTTSSSMCHPLPSGDASAADDATHRPEIVTALPGPKTKALIEQDTRYISPSYTRGYPLSIAKGQGAMVTDLDGNRFLDFCAGIAVCATGHSHPKVVEAVTRQAQDFIHMSGTDFYYSPMVELAELLDKLSPGTEPKKIFFSNSGAESNEGAIKLARYHTGRPNIISFFKGFHGRTYGAMSVSASKPTHRHGFTPLMPGVFYAHYPNPYRCMFNTQTPEACADAALNYIEEVLFKTVAPPDEVAAFLIEPIQGEGGYVVPPDSFMSRLSTLAKKHGILIIADEVQSGIGRTGKFFASAHYEGFDPDIITSAKGLASGMPLGAIIAKASVMNWPAGAHATTFGGNPVSCAAAIATLHMVEECLQENARQLGEVLLQKLQGLVAQYDVLGEARGKGLMIGLEVVESKASKTKAPKLRDAIVDQCFEHGLLVLGCGDTGIRFSPPLIIDETHVNVAVELFEQALKDCIAKG